MFNKLFKNIWLKHPRTGERDAMLTLMALTVLVCVVKFFFEGVSVTLFGHTLSLGHADPLSYGAILSPVLGAHATREWRIPSAPNLTRGTAEVDDPDGN